MDGWMDGWIYVCMDASMHVHIERDTQRQRRTEVYIYIHTIHIIYIYIDMYGQASGVFKPPPPNGMV